MKGVPLRLEVGPKDVENGNAVLARRDNDEKQVLKKEDLANQVPVLLDAIQVNMLEQAKAFRESNTCTVSTYDEFKDVIISKGGFVRCGWDGTEKSEMAIKDDTKATIRVIPFDENPEGMTCIYSGKPAKHEVIFAKAY
jgi:prolyl-tRNA synthetase